MRLGLDRHALGSEHIVVNEERRKYRANQQHRRAPDGR
jgi:hypothetical protein